MADYLTNRDGIWYLVRRVPDTVAALDRRVIVRQTTKVRVADDPRGAKARRVVDALNAELETYWRGLLAGQSQDAQERYDAARRRARGFGFDYRLASTLAELPDDELLARIRTIIAQPRSAEAAAVTAVLGGEAPAPLRLSTLFAEFERLSAAANRDLSPDQQRKWRNPKLRAIANLVDVTGDRPLEEVTRAHALDCRDWWQKRVLAEGIEIATTNKDFGHLNPMFKAVERAHRLGLGPVFGEMRIGGEVQGQRTAFPAAWVQDKAVTDPSRAYELASRAC
ncbi:hypothetical protein [Methylobacterium frigidaeris]|uniref:Integrase n=1 Tax=Methylobacterium frigidaeris TaxID=2038277 RepID=A0AA37H7S4_9HYPH|nr:hypothetical protein [Methylobacterium frigidaeris]GJD60854.1 hypothetical protein MPEAHAMD_0994 [Methylobacterium frigidaeris]